MTEIITLEGDITVFTVAAATFPEGIIAAHQQLHALVPFSAGRKYLGVSRPENGPIVYRAAAEVLEGEDTDAFPGSTMQLKGGRYICTTLHDYRNDLQGIDRAFKDLLAGPGLDPEGYCVEWYVNDRDMRCMIRLMQ
jgi:hypothetical protein